MKKNIIKLSFAFIFSLLLIFSSTIFAASDYDITAYDVDIDVNEDNSLDITETITVYFNTAKHGIVREIPLKNTITRTDGTTSKNSVKVSNVSVSENYSSSKSSNYLSLQIGSSSKTITGEHTYVISYTYSLGNDPLEDADELYFNIIGTEWDTSISNATFTITMPKEFDESLLGFSSGKYGSTSNSNITYSVDGTVITGECTSTLAAGEGITIRLTLPDGYFATTIEDPYVLITIALSILFVIISAILWLKFGKDDKVIETVEFYPPDGYNPAEIAFMHDGYINSNGVISLLVYLANKGYLKIEQTEMKNLFLSSKVYKFIKLKDYDGDNENERLFLSGLFKNNNEVTVDDLTNVFYTTVNKIKRNINKNISKIISGGSSMIKLLLWVMIAVIFIAINTMPFIYTQEYEYIVMTLLFMGFPLSILSLVAATSGDSKSRKISVISIGIFIFPFILVPLLQFVIDALVQCSSVYTIMYIIGVICIVVIANFLVNMKKRTPYGTEIYGKIKGFKKFIEVARKDELERLVMESPKYFYDILPYAYALGVSDKWMSQFEDIALEPSDWYDSPDGEFRMSEFSSFLNDTMKSARSSMTSSPSSDSDSGGGSSGGGSSGGGSSGGGSGGGGGSSW